MSLFPPLTFALLPQPTLLDPFGRARVGTKVIGAAVQANKKREDQAGRLDPL